MINVQFTIDFMESILIYLPDRAPPTKRRTVAVNLVLVFITYDTKNMKP